MRPRSRQRPAPRRQPEEVICGNKELLRQVPMALPHQQQVRIAATRALEGNARPVARPGWYPYAFGSYPGGMPLAREQRKLAAIVAADVVGYSRLMGRDESGTLARLRKNRS